jgi:hypothetical protein
MGISHQELALPLGPGRLPLRFALRFFLSLEKHTCNFTKTGADESAMNSWRSSQNSSSTHSGE